MCPHVPHRPVPSPLHPSFAGPPVLITVGDQAFRLEFTDRLVVDGRGYNSLVDSDRGSLIVSTEGLPEENAHWHLRGRIGSAVVFAWWCAIGSPTLSDGHPELASWEPGKKGGDHV